jgi:hypothetical protein
MSTVASDQWKLLIQDFVQELLADIEAGKASDRSDDFELGRRTACYELLDRLRLQAGAFGLDANEIGFRDVDLEDRLL